jgi:ATP-dependent RNA helicase SUPV3L1/SUV3
MPKIEIVPLVVSPAAPLAVSEAPASEAPEPVAADDAATDDAAPVETASAEPVLDERTPVETAPVDLALEPAGMAEPGPEAAVAEAPVSDVLATADEPPPPAEPAPAEPVLVEVWRPARFDREQARRGAHRGQGGRGRPDRARAGASQPVDGAAPVGEQAATDAAPRPPRRGGKPWQRRDGQPEGEKGERRFEGRTRGGTPGGDGPRDNRARDGKPNDGKPRDGKPRDGRPGAERPGRDGRPQRRDERSGPRQWTSAPPQASRGKELDPNSPFAQLAALKAKLEAGKQ